MTRRARLLVVVALGSCRSERGEPIVPDVTIASDEARAGDEAGAGGGNGRTGSEVATSPYDSALAEMVAQCTPVIEAGGAEGPARVHERRIDLDRDGDDEAIFNVGCGDVSQWKLLAEQDGEAVVLLERIATETEFDVLIGPDGSGLLVVQHDCCCRYELEVHTLKGDALRQLFAWSSGCGPGCDSGYEAEVTADPNGNLRAITLPGGSCGSEGVEQVDLRTWTVAPGGSISPP